MDLFQSIKSNVSIPEAAEAYGIQPNRHGMARCPFHDDRNPSLKLNPDYYYCFGCGATGDVIDLAAQLFSLNPYEAAKKLADDFGIDPTDHQTGSELIKPKHPYVRALEEDERYCRQVLSDYLSLLRDWRIRYAPRPEDESLDDRFVESCQMLDVIEHYLDILAVGELEERISIVRFLMKDGKIQALEEMVKRKQKGGEYSVEKNTSCKCTCLAE